jgi:hypothetical protein
VAAPRSTSLVVYLLIAVCLILLAPYFGLHLFLTEAPETLENRGSDTSLQREFSSSNEPALQEPKPSKALLDIEELLER